MVPKTPFFEVSIPNVPTHDAFVELVPRIMKYLAFASAPVIISIALLSLFNSVAIVGAGWLVAPIVAMLLIGVGMFIAVCVILSTALSTLDEFHKEWKLDQSTQREIALSRAIEINVSGKNNQVNINPTTTNNTLNLGTADTPAQTRLKFLRHVEEFYRTSLVRGHERANYLVSDGADENYQYTCDGERMDRAEYNDILKVLVASGKIKGRRKGRSGDAEIVDGSFSPITDLAVSHPKRVGD